jgi:hypothetical protein
MSLRLQSARTVEEACANCRPASNRKSAEMSKIGQRCALLNLLSVAMISLLRHPTSFAPCNANPVVHAARLRLGRKSQASRAVQYGHLRALTCDRSFQQLRPTPHSGASRSAQSATSQSGRAARHRCNHRNRTSGFAPSASQNAARARHRSGSHASTQRAGVHESIAVGSSAARR